MHHNTASLRRFQRALRVFVAWYAGTLFALAFILLIALFMIDQLESGQVWTYWWLTVKKLLSEGGTYVIAFFPYLIFVIIRENVRRYKNTGWTGVAGGLIRYVALPIALIWTGLEVTRAYRNSEDFTYTWDTSVEHAGSQARDLYQQDGKHRGIHVFNLSADTSDLALLKANNIEWITLVPYISQELHNEPPLQASSESVSDSSSVGSSSIDRIAQHAALAAHHNFRLAIKPHVWLSAPQAGAWRSDIEMQNEADWDTWFSYYTRRMLAYAALAEQLNADLFCVGTELHSTIVAKPEQWRSLISQIRSVYSGKLTYAANWSDNLENIPFWDMLDYIGIQAYFPVADVKNPSLQEIEMGWQPHVDRLSNLAEKYQKPVLFTEIGYRSIATGALTPWEWSSTTDFFRRVSHQTQAWSYQAFFNEVWHEPWFAGAHLWEWSANHRKDGRNTGFSMGGKPALNLVARGFYPVVSSQPDSTQFNFGLLP
ncbi:MAG: hypothetical protein AAF564_15245 [Bacteroidota bacterium]